MPLISSTPKEGNISIARNKVIEFKYGELFSGPGGLALGAVQAIADNGLNEFKIVHSWSSDYDEDTCKTYRKNIAFNDPESVTCTDVRNLDLERLGHIDAFAYGFPCNDFSIVGEQRGFEGTYGPLYTYGIKVLNLHRPKFFVAENVSGLTSANEGRAFKKIINDLSSSGNGYVITAHKYKAEKYGVPQTRHRVILVGIDKTFGLRYSVPAPTHKNRYITAREALEIPPISSNAFNNEHKRQSPLVVKRLEMIPAGENVWTAKLPPHLRLNVKNAKLSQIYKRLHPDKPSYTITGSGGGGTHGYHYSEPRALTNRERARIQTFPDSFRFEGSIESVRRQIGMAVPPILSKIVFEAVLKTFAGITYEAVESNIMIDGQLEML